MKEIDQFARKIMLVFDCPRCGNQIKYIVNELPKEDLAAENYSDSVETDLIEFDCFSCKQEHFKLLLASGQGDKSLEITNSGSKYPLDEDNVEVQVLEYIK